MKGILHAFKLVGEFMKFTIPRGGEKFPARLPLKKASGNKFCDMSSSCLQSIGKTVGHATFSTRHVALASNAACPSIPIQMTILDRLMCLLTFNCKEPINCPSLVSEIGQATVKLDTNISPQYLGSVRCAGGSTHHPFSVNAASESCPEDWSRDHSILASKINEQCLNPLEVRDAVGKWLKTDFVGSAYVVSEIFGIQPAEATATCSGDETDIELWAYWSVDLRAVAGDKFVHLKDELTKVTADWDVHVASVLEPVSWFLTRIATEPSQTIPIEVTISRQSLLHSVALKTDHGRDVNLEFYAAAGDVPHVVVAVQYPEEPPMAGPSEECQTCVAAVGFKDSHCLTKSIRNRCGVVTDLDCEEDLSKMRSKCESQCLV